MVFGLLLVAEVVAATAIAAIYVTRNPIGYPGMFAAFTFGMVVV